MTGKRKQSVFKISYIMILLIISILAFVWYSNILKSELRGLVRNTLKEVSTQNVLVVQKEIQGDLNALTEIAERIGALEDFEEDEIMKLLTRISYRYSFKKLSFSWPDGASYSTDGVGLDISEREYFKAAMRGETYISEPFADAADGEEIIVFSMPVSRNGEIAGVVYIIYQVESLKEMLSVTSFDGEGYTYIVQQNGDKVVDSTNPTSFQNMTNIYKSMEEADERNAREVEKLKVLLENGETGYVIFYNKIGKYMYATPLGINDWFLIDVVPVDFMESTSNHIIYRTYIVCGVLAVVCGIIAVLLFLEERRKKQQMQNLLYVDDLTGGNTLTKFKQDARHNVIIHDENAAIVVMDLDDFKLINELFGYEEGNRVICHIGEVLQNSCGPKECVGHSIADRFYMLLYCEDEQKMRQRIMKMAEEIQRFPIPNASEYILHPVFGIYFVKKGSLDVEDMLDSASLAHNFAKQERDCIYRIYTDAMKEKMLQNKHLSDQIEYAYNNHEFVVYYQPKYESETQRLAGAEALVRWRKPDGEMVSPGVFIPLAEESGFVRKLDEYVFREVCFAQKRWLDKGLKIVPISVNLSARHLDNPDFIDDYKDILDASGVPIEYIQLELTESAMFEKQDEAIGIMEKLHKLGFMILMDDFGTGYSSLMMLKSVPVDVMKLDKTFVDDYNDARGEQIIRSVMQMAQKLSIAITAEGVETEEQFKFLKSIGCDTIQGYYFARPMPEEEYEKCMEQKEGNI